MKAPTTPYFRADVPMPPRYRHYWRDPFDHAAADRFRPGVRVLDIGSGRVPSFSPERRPHPCHYVGLDISETELRAAGPDAYDECVAADITDLQPNLVESFDLALSWQVLEHVADLRAAAENIRLYLRPGGVSVSLLSGGLAAFAVANRLIPDRIGHRIVQRTMHRTPDESPVFPAHYDRCSAQGLRDAFGAFGSVRVVPFYRAATYFAFSRTMMRLYLRYENLIYQRNVERLATHYLVIATR